MIAANAFIVAVALTVPSAGPAAQACLMPPEACSFIQGPEFERVLAVAKKPSNQWTDNEPQMMHVLQLKLGDDQNEANRGCRRKDKVDLDGFQPIFVLGSGKKKRALFAKGSDMCAWVRVK